MEGTIEPRGQRVRLTCTPCHRRKIKCDKNIPCDTCIRRGIADVCCREGSGLTDGVPVTPTQSATGSAASSDTVRALLRRVSELEARLREGTQAIVEQTPAAADSIGGQTQAPALETWQPVTTRDGSIATPSVVDGDDGDAATVLEFLAWGRKKDCDFVNAPEHDNGPRQPVSAQEEQLSPSNPLNENTRISQLEVLEALLPRKSHILQLVEFHNNSLLWYHGSYPSKNFSGDLQVFFDEYRGNIRHEQLNIQWLALLFSVLAGSITCASPSTCRTWGFSVAEQQTLAAQWYEATVTCLNLGKYVEVHTIYSVQAVATLTIAAHILGYSNSQSVLLAAAGRIAQSLGLHRLEACDPNATPDQLRKSEAGKRLFIQLCTQDWFSIPFSETYALNPRFISDAIRPLNCNDDRLEVHPETMPTQASYCNYRFDIASLMPQLLDAMASCNTAFTRYEQVLKFDNKMRKLATASMPTFLSSNAPVAADWPAYVGWARRSLTICASHKIIMIHRKFIGLSFTTTAFSFTRRTCLAASKTILREAFAATDEAGPVLWIDQAFSVAAGIILSLDTLHRSPSEKEFDEHKQLVADTIQYLSNFEHSKIATRGVKLLSFLQRKIEQPGGMESRKRSYAVMTDGHTTPSHGTRAVNLQSVIRDVSQSLGVTSEVTNSTPTPSVDVMDNGWDALLDLLPDQIGFDSQYLFDNFFPGNM